MGSNRVGSFAARAHASLMKLKEDAVGDFAEITQGHGNLGQHRVEAQIDDGLMAGRYLVQLRLRALMLPKLTRRNGIPDGRDP
jgi:hypothetical protein